MLLHTSTQRHRWWWGAGVRARRPHSPQSASQMEAGSWMDPCSVSKKKDGRVRANGVLEKQFSFSPLQTAAVRLVLSTKHWLRSKVNSRWLSKVLFAKGPHTTDPKCKTIMAVLAYNPDANAHSTAMQVEFSKQTVTVTLVKRIAPFPCWCSRCSSFHGDGNEKQRPLQWWMQH